MLLSPSGATLDCAAIGVLERFYISLAEGARGCMERLCLEMLRRSFFHQFGHPNSKELQDFEDPKR